MDRAASRGGGLLIAVRNSIPAYAVTLPSASMDGVESLGVRFWLEGIWVRIYNVYNPGGTFPKTWFDRVVQITEDPFLIVGDFNINLLRRDPPIPTNVRDFQEWMLAQQLCILNLNTPTRNVYGASPSLLDLTLYSPNFPFNISFSVHPDPFDSDHMPVTVSLNKTHSISSANIRFTTHWASASSTLNQDLDTTDSSCSTFDDFVNCCQSAIAANRRTRPPNNVSRTPWWDATCRQLLGQKRRSLRLARTFCNKDHWMQYKRAASRLRRYIKKVSRNYWDTVCRTSCSNGHIFKILKALARRNCSQGDNVLWQTGPVATAREQAAIFLEFFSQNDPKNPLPFDLSGDDQELNAPFNTNELLHAIQKTRPTTPGADGISIRLFQHLSVKNAKKIVDMFNSMFDTGTVPSSWKLATIVPIHKTGKPTHLASSYRPIALTSVCGKIFERLLLRRLIRWSGSKNLFHPAHFGFFPFRDCTTVLSKFFEDIANARDSRQVAIAVSLDIRAAYDSVWIDGLIYKMASMGICGKIGLWIASFLTDRAIQIKWKSVVSHHAPSLRGVPQGAVLSPFLYMVFMADVFEACDSGVNLLVYADDILLYAIGPDMNRTLSKMQDNINRLTQWCESMKLAISTDKSVAVNFSRRRDLAPPLKILGSELPWSPSIKVLGVWFSKNLTFGHHFAFLRTKAFKRLNYAKAVISHRQGVSSRHMLHIVNALIRSMLEYASPILLNACPTTLQKVEIIYNAALRMATGLPQWTPIPVLRREAGVSSVASRFSLLTNVFLIRQLALPLGSLFSDHLRNLKSNNVSRIGCRSAELLSRYSFSHENLIPFTWPPEPSALPNIHLLTEGLPFQDVSLPNDAIQQHWLAWCSSLIQCTLVATDASKDQDKTAVAAYNVTDGTSIAMLTSHLNSVFTAEALALQLAVTSFVKDKGKYVFLSDSLSVLQALRSINIKSPHVILKLHHHLDAATRAGNNVILIWCPGHKGIGPNEKADSLARSGPYHTSTLNQIAPEDIVACIRRDWVIEIDYSWLNSGFSHNFPHLTPDRRYSDWTRSRREDIWIARWRTRTWITNNTLHKMQLVSSPLCRDCYSVETLEHILLACPNLAEARALLFNTLRITSPTCYSDVISKATVSPKSVSALVLFSSAVLLSRC